MEKQNKEQQKVKAANSAKPTTMPNKAADDLLNSASEELDDLPFA